jgi:hypothetical protein
MVNLGGMMMTDTKLPPGKKDLVRISPPSESSCDATVDNKTHLEGNVMFLPLSTSR